MNYEPTPFTPEENARWDGIAKVQAAYYGTTPERWSAIINAWCDDDEQTEGEG